MVLEKKEIDKSEASGHSGWGVLRWRICIVHSICIDSAARRAGPTGDGGTVAQRQRAFSRESSISTSPRRLIDEPEKGGKASIDVWGIFPAN